MYSKCCHTGPVCKGQVNKWIWLSVAKQKLAFQAKDALQEIRPFWPKIGQLEEAGQFH